MARPVLDALHGAPVADDPTVPWVVDGPLARVGPLATLAEEWDAHRLAEAAHHPLKVRAPGEAEAWLGVDGPVAAEDRVAAVEAAEVAAFWAIEQTVTEVAPWLVDLARELGVPADRVTANAYRTQAGHGYGEHLDPYEVYVVQLAGEKEWWLAPGAADVRWPLHSLTLGAPDQDIPRYLAAAAAREAMPDPALHARLRPGSVLYVPRGWWHRTRAVTASWSVSVTVATPSWAELLLRIVAGHVGDLETYREPAFGALAPASGRPATAAADLGARLAALADELGRADPSHLLDELGRP